MEIEVKIKTENLEGLKEELVKLGASFILPVEQVDEYYKLKGKEKETQRPGSFILRIREQEQIKRFTVKALTETTGAWIEHETGVEDPEELRKILELVGFTNVFTIKKTRTYGKLKNFEICLDDVEGLGKFVEFEIISDNPEEGKAKIMEIVTKLGLSDDQIEHRGYAAIIAQNMGVKFEGTNG